MTDLIISDPAMTEASAAKERTPQVIAAEINTIKYQAGRIMLYSIIEIGRRLKEAKTKVPHGEWSTWLKESVSFSQSRAEKLMRIATTYGSEDSASLGTGTRTQTLSNLTYSQALLLLGIPEEERAEFISELDIESLTTQELKKAIDEKKAALLERDQAREERNQAVEAGQQTTQELEQLTQDHNDLKKQVNEKDSELSRLTTVNQSLDQQVNDCRPHSGNEQKSLSENEVMPKEDRDNSDYAEKITQLENQIKTTEGLIPIKTAEAKYIFYRDQLLRAFENVQMALKVLNDKDPEVKEQHREAAYEMMKNLTKQLEVYPPVPTFIVM